MRSRNRKIKKQGEARLGGELRWEGKLRKMRGLRKLCGVIISGVFVGESGGRERGAGAGGGGLCNG